MPVAGDRQGWEDMTRRGKHHVSTESPAIYWLYDLGQVS